MAQVSDNRLFEPDLYLEPDQQDLLLAALSSNNPKPSNGTRQGLQQPSATQNPISTENDMSSYLSLNDTSLDDSAILDFDPELDLDGNFEYDESPPDSGQLEDAPRQNSSSAEEGHESHDIHDKRKNSQSEKDDEEGGGKRREGEDKTAKKPGRKPLTSEPTTKRKAQNRAAQRAFRERKEKHLKDLEIKVAELEKTSDSTNHENGVLRSQVEKLTMELKEYRKRLSLNSSQLNRSNAPSTVNQAYLPQANMNNFHFDFPKFGVHASPSEKPAAVPTTESSDSLPSAIAPGVSERTVSSSSYDTEIGVANSTPTDWNLTASPTTGIEGLTGLFSPSILEDVNKSSSSDYLSYKDTPPALSHDTPPSHSGSSSNVLPRQGNGSYHSASTSPSISSMSHNGQGSSCGTSPESSTQSPPASKLMESSLDTIREEGAYRGFATGQQMIGRGDLNSVSLTKTPASEINGIDWLAQQNGGQFDPVLFGDYREPQDAITSGEYPDFFSDAFAVPDFGTPGSGAIATNMDSPDQQKTLPAELSKCPKDVAKLISHNDVWNRLQADPKFKNGEIDIDGLCSELKKKARCSETGIAIEQNDLDAALANAPRHSDSLDFSGYGFQQS